MGCLVLLLAAWIVAPQTWAQAANYSGVTSTVSSGFSGPYGVAVDSSGDVFVADTSNDAVKEVLPVNGRVSSTSTVQTVGGKFSGLHL